MNNAAASSSAPLIFVVEDNPADVRLVKEGVDATDIELELEVINSGHQAANRLTTIEADAPQNHPDLILLDLNLPGRSGFDLLETVRTETAFQDVPVVIVSSSENVDDITRAYELTANAYITKPADPDDYIRMINATVDFWIVTTAPPVTNDKHCTYTDSPHRG